VESLRVERLAEGSGLTLHFDKLSVPSLPKEEAFLYPVRNNALLFSPSQRLSKPEVLPARLRPGRAHAPEGGPLSEPEAPLSRRLGRRLQRGFRIIPGSAP